MRYTEFHIEGYKAIENVTISMAKRVIPLIGINESGKTTVLQAILAFDKAKDKLLDGEHVDVKNKYKTQRKQKECVLIAKAKIVDSAEGDEIISAAKLKTDGDLYAWIRDIFDRDIPIAIRRIADGRGGLTNEYELIDAPAELKESAEYKRLVKALYDKLPNILYFDDFNDRVPAEIRFKASYADNPVLHSSGSTREWQEIVIEIFNRALEGDMSLVDFINVTDDEDELANNINDISDELNSQIINEWNKLKEAHGGLVGSGESDLDLSIKCNRENDDYVFKFKVTDKKSQGSGRVFNINQRSKGFQWFFNFIVKLKFNPKYKTNPKNAIYLLDEPGSYLHSMAQTELLGKLLEISQENTILYCTHSQYLLDPDLISINDIKIVSREDEAIRVDNYGEFPQEKTLGAYSALRDALHLKYGFMTDGLKNVVLVEGISDRCFFKLFCDLPDVTVVPGCGCTHLRQLISILIATSDRFLVVLDKDREGTEAYKKYEDIFGNVFSENAYQYSLNMKGEITPEKILDSEATKTIKELTGCKDIKTAIIQLYYSKDSDLRVAALASLSDKTKKNIDELSNVIMRHFADE